MASELQVGPWRTTGWMATAIAVGVPWLLFGAGVMLGFMLAR